MSSDLIKQKVNTLTVITLIAAIIETVLLIPIIGGTIVVIFCWIPLVVLFGLYVAGLINTSQLIDALPDNKLRNSLVGFKSNYITGLVLAVIAVIPFIGWISHIVMAVIMWTTYSNLSVLNNDLQRKQPRKDVTPKDDSAKK